MTISVFAVLTAALVMAVWWAATTEERTGTYLVRGTVNGITLDIGDADLDIIGGGTQARSRSRAPTASPSATPPRPSARARRHPAPALALPAGADRQLLVVLPPARPRQRAGHGAGPRAATWRPAAIAARRASTRRRATSNFDGWCGFLLQIRADAGDVRAVAACAPERLELRSRQGRVDALVPPGRYRVDAESDEGRRHVRGIDVADDAPFQIQALSTTGDVSVGAGRDRPRRARLDRLRPPPAAGRRALAYLRSALPLGLVSALAAACWCSAPRSA